MAYIDYNEMLNTAKENFINGNYKLSEPLLKQLLLVKNSEPEVFQMLATIYYDQGKFNKAIKTFKRALEIDPGYTDASIGLSIILNDLGRYEEGKKIFLDAKERLDKKDAQMDPFVEEKLAAKHCELADLYNHHKRHNEAIEQLYKALKLSSKKEEITLQIADSYVKDSKGDNAVKTLTKFLKDYPQSTGARLKLGLIYYNGNRIIEATEQWEQILMREPEHPEAKSYLKLAQKTGVTELPNL